MSEGVRRANASDPLPPATSRTVDADVAASNTRASKAQRPGMQRPGDAKSSTPPSQPDDLVFLKETYADGTEFVTGTRADSDGNTDQDGANLDVMFLSMIPAEGQPVAIQRASRPEAGEKSEWIVRSGPRQGEQISSPAEIFGPGAFFNTDSFTLRDKEPVSFNSTSIDYGIRPQTFSSAELLRNNIDIEADDARVVSIKQVDDGKNEGRFAVTLDGGLKFFVDVDQNNLPENSETGEKFTARDLVEKFSENFAKLPRAFRGLSAITPFEISTLPINKTLDPSSPKKAAGRYALQDDTIRFSPGFIATASDDVMTKKVQGVILHELGHRVDNYIAQDDRKDFLENWEGLTAKDGGASSKYGASAPVEDFAETFVLWAAARSGAVPERDVPKLEADFANRFAFLDGKLMKDGEFAFIELAQSYRSNNRGTAGTEAEDSREPALPFLQRSQAGGR